MTAICAALLWLLPAQPSGGPPLTRAAQAETLGRALQAFDEGGRLSQTNPVGARKKFEDARSGFESLVAAGVRNGRLLYNLGNTYVRLGEIGRAIVCYRRAERLMPGDANLTANLAFARGLRADRLDEAASSAAIRSLLFWHYGTSLSTRLTLGLIAYLLFWLFMLVRLRYRPAPAALNWTARILVLVWIVLAVSLAADTYRARNVIEGVTIVDDVVLRKGNGEAYVPQFDHRFSQGIEFTLIEPARGNWLHVQLPDGKDGWIRSDQAELL